MKKKLLLTFLFLYSTLSIAQEYANNRIILKYSNKNYSNKQKEVNSILKEYTYKINPLSNKKLQKGSDTNNILLLTFDKDISVRSVIKKLKNTGAFEYVEPDFKGYGGGKKFSSLIKTTPDDTYFSRQWGLKNDGTFSLSTAKNGADVDMELAWDITTGNSNITIAVLDSGIRFSHPEFTERIWNNPSESSNSTDSDGNGFIDDVQGWDFVNNDNNPTDDHGHGTNVTGIITANANNNLGYAGVDTKCKIMPLKILDDNNSGLYSHWIAAINYAVDNGAKIINMSVGGSGFSQAMKEAVDYAHSKNVIVTACMMNFNNETSYYPAAYQNTIAIGSTDPDDTRSAPFFWSNTSGSNYGSHIDVVAPGNYIYGLSYSSDTNYNSYWGGTSQSTPLVTGIISLILDKKPNLTVQEVRNILRNTAEDKVGDSEDTTGWDKYYGAGRVNAYNALQSVLSIDDNSIEKIIVSPNPTKNLITLPQKVNNKKYHIYDILGKTVATGKINDRSLDFSELDSGIYFLKIKSEQITFTSKIIKQ